MQYEALIRRQGTLPLVFASLLILGWTQVENQEPVVLGQGEHTFEWVRDWAKLPEGMSLGNTHGCVLVDSQNRVYLNTDTENAVVVFDADGSFLHSFGKELSGGLHGMCLVREGEEEFLYLTHTGRHEVLKATLEGEILWTRGYPEESGIYENAGGYRPTSVAVTPDGRLFVADGYGASWIHEYDASGTYVRSFGGPGQEQGKLRTPHGIVLDTRSEEPRLLVSDRENNRLQSFDLDGVSKAVVEDLLRRPCHTQARGKEVVVADLAGRVTILDGENRLVCHLGDQPDPKKRAQNGIPSTEWKPGEFISPHCASWDADGNLYVVDWVAEGRITKLVRKGSR